MITNETIIKAAKAAGLNVTLVPVADCVVIDKVDCLQRVFDPLHNDSDSALIRRGAEIDVQFWSKEAYREASVEVDAWIKQPDGDLRGVTVEVKSDDKASAEREAVILCAAAKFDAMNEGVK